MDGVRSTRRQPWKRERLDDEVGQDALPESVGTVAAQTFAREPE